MASMKTTFALLSILASSATAHYYFPILVINGVESPEWKYVRDVAPDPETPGDLTRYKGYPQYNMSSPDIVCGRDAFKSAGKTQTLDIKAGESVGFHISHDLDSDPSWNNYIYHQGPAQAYMSRAPNDDLSTFSGIWADWFKVAFIGQAHDSPVNPDSWITYHTTSINVTIPAKTPPGKYLLRLEHFEGDCDPQFFINCAQVNVINDGAVGTFKQSDFVQFPNAYNPRDTLLRNMYKFKPLTYVKGPGPDVWTGA